MTELKNSEALQFPADAIAGASELTHIPEGARSRVRTNDDLSVCTQQHAAIYRACIGDEAVQFSHVEHFGDSAGLNQNGTIRLTSYFNFDRSN